MSQQIIVDDRRLKVVDVLKDASLCRLLSTEGPIDAADIVGVAAWGQ